MGDDITMFVVTLSHRAPPGARAETDGSVHNANSMDTRDRRPGHQAIGGGAMWWSRCRRPTDITERTGRGHGDVNRKEGRSRFPRPVRPVNPRPVPGAPPAAGEVTITMATVGDPGNPSVGVIQSFGGPAGHFVNPPVTPKDTGIYKNCSEKSAGRATVVPYGRWGRLRYGIGEFDVTVSQYVTFVNMVNPSGRNALQLYFDDMNPAVWHVRGRQPGDAGRWRSRPSATSRETRTCHGRSVARVPNRRHRQAQIDAEWYEVREDGK